LGLGFRVWVEGSGCRLYLRAASVGTRVGHLSHFGHESHLVSWSHSVSRPSAAPPPCKHSVKVDYDVKSRDLLQVDCAVKSCDRGAVFPLAHPPVSFSPGFPGEICRLLACFPGCNQLWTDSRRHRCLLSLSHKMCQSNAFRKSNPK
jgi:hypothetical protein